MSSEKSREIRSSRKSAVLGTLAGGLMKLWSYTLRFEIVDECGITTPGTHQGPVIFALWHNRIFTIPPVWWRTGGKQRKAVALTSASHDGDVVAHAMAVFGLGSVRGSSSRRGVTALLSLKRALLEGFDVCLTPDGPRGPRYQFQPGVIKLAESSGSSIVPIHIQFSAAWRIKSWDRFVIPKPFSRVKVIFAAAVPLPRGMSPEVFESARLNLETILRNGADDV
jgi:lysophospholipid acyltransferase (LPLAT)-like uncharacterized protein